MTRHREKHCASKGNCQEKCVYPRQPPCDTVRHPLQQCERAETFDCHRNHHNPCRALLMLHCDRRGAFHWHNSQQWVMHNLHEPDHSHHHPRGEKVQDESSVIHTANRIRETSSSNTTQTISYSEISTMRFSSMERCAAAPMTTLHRPSSTVTSGATPEATASMKRLHSMKLAPK